MKRIESAQALCLASCVGGATSGRKWCFRGRMRVRAFVVALAAASLIAALSAPFASGAWYKASRPGLTVVLRTQGHQVAELRMRFTQHCDDGRVTHPASRFPEFDRPINQETNRFRWRDLRSADGYTSKEGGQGTVRRRLITGRFYAKDFVNTPRRRAKCWTGQSLADPYVSFVARRLR